jgi:hypothetical protein
MRKHRWTSNQLAQDSACLRQEDAVGSEVSDDVPELAGDATTLFRRRSLEIPGERKLCSSNLLYPRAVKPSDRLALLE